MFDNLDTKYVTGDIAKDVQFIKDNLSIDDEQFFKRQLHLIMSEGNARIESLTNELAAEVELVAELATAPATIEQLLSFQVGDFIELDLDPMIKAKVDGVPVFDCTYGSSNNKYAIKINEMLTGADQSWLGARHGT